MNFIKNKTSLVFAVAVISYLSVTSSSLISTLSNGNNKELDSDYTILIKKQLLELPFFEKYRNMSYEEIALLADEESGETLQEFPYYENKPYAEKIVRKIAKSDLWAFLKHFDNYKNKDFIPSIVNTIPIDDELFFRIDYIPEHKLFEPILLFFEGLYHIKEVKVANKVISLTRLQHGNIYSGLLKTYLADKKEYLNSDNSINREKVKIRYEENVRHFIEQGNNWSELTKENTHTFWVRVSHAAGDDRGDAFGYDDANLKRIYKEKFTGAGKFHDYSSNINPQSADYILDAFENNIKQYPRDKHFFYLGAHGEKDGSARLKGGNRTKKDFDRLFNIKTKYPNNIKIDISGCDNWYKDSDFHDNRIKNISMDSGKHASRGGEGSSDRMFIQAFEAKDENGKLEADYNLDGLVNLNEALFYRNIYCTSSSTPTMSDDGSGGRAKDISMSDGIYRDASLYSS